MKSLADFRPVTHMFVDAMNFCARSYYGMMDLSYNGHRTGMLYGVARLVMEWREKHPHMKIVFVWEGQDSWRKAKYPIYKSSRVVYEGAEPDLEYPRSRVLVQESLTVMGVDQVAADTYEADDTVYTVSEGLSGKALFVSNDWDWWPLVSRGDIVYHDHQSKQTIVLNHDDMGRRFAKKFNCAPISMGRLWLFKVLSGDSSDSVLGIPRFYKKIAAELANDPYVTIDNIPEQLRIRGQDKWADVVAANRDILERNFELLLPKPPPISEVKMTPGVYSEEGFENVLLKSGMADMFERLSKGTV